MLYTFLLVLLVIDCFVLMLAILLQSGKGTGLAASFGGASSSPDALIGIRQAGNLLTKISWWGGGIFLGLCFHSADHVDATRGPALGSREGTWQPAAERSAAADVRSRGSARASADGARSDGNPGPAPTANAAAETSSYHPEAVN